MSAREQIITAVVAALNTSPSVGATVYRSRVTPIARGESPAIVVEPVADVPDYVLHPYISWKLGLRISVITRNEVPDQAADPIISKIHEKMSADLTFGGLAYDCQIANVGWEIVESDMPTGVISLDYFIWYRTAQNIL